MKNFRYLFSILVLSFYAGRTRATDYMGLTNLSDVNLSDVSITGPANLDNVTLSSARIIGTLQFEKLTINNNADITGPVDGSFGKFGKLNVTGPLTLQQSEIDSLQVTGPTNLINVKIKNDANIVGNFEALKSSFRDLTITAISMQLSDSKINNIVINENSKKRPLKVEQVLKLENNTLVDGDITFKSGMGKILLSKDSKISGKVAGAKVDILEH